MVAVPYRNVWLLCLISTICCILGVSSIEVATTMPPKVKALLDKANVSSIKELLNDSRRILNGRQAHFGRPYMVYLKLPTNNAKYQDYKTWLCSGVIVHDEYILTSAACIEDVRHFYVVSGTDKYSPEDDMYSNQCIKNGAKKAIWKCIPRNYIFDGHENDNIRWMNNDIAVVRVEEEFDFTRKIRGCDYVPKPICYNNQSLQREAPDTEGSIAGWGSTDKYNDWVNTRRQEERGRVNLMETVVTVMEKGPCKKRWGSRYANIIDNYMICTRDMSTELSEICQEKYVDCVDIASGEDDFRRSDNTTLQLHSAHEHGSMRRTQGVIVGGGFCENDHGGPLVVGQGINSMVIGVISACLVKEKTNKCYGPFLYTSVFKNRMMINCAIYKDVGSNCNKMFRAGSTHTELEMSWSDHADGPSKHDIKKMRRMEEEAKAKLKEHSNFTESSTVNASIQLTTVGENSSITQTTEPQVSDKVMEHSGLVLRSGPEPVLKKKVSKGKVKKP